MKKIVNICFILIASICYIWLPIQVEARVMNIEKEGSLIIHKFLNPTVNPVGFGGSGFLGDGSLENGLQGGDPLPGVEFSVFGKLTETERKSLLQESTVEVDEEIDVKNQMLDAKKVAEFIKTKEPVFVGVTNEEGIVTWENIPINTVDLSDNTYLIVETKTPGVDSTGQAIVQEPSLPVLVNIPSNNPKEDQEGSEVNNYLYDVNIFMKNYQQEEPGIEKSIDKDTHGKGEEVKYTITITPLSVGMDEYQELEVTDELGEKVNFSHLGHNPEISEKESVQFYNGTTKKTIILVPEEDYTVSTPSPKETGVIKWVFTPQGIKKLSGVEAGDGSYIKLYFSAFMGRDVMANEVIPNNATLDFVNKWGYGTKPGTGKPPVSSKPSNTVNTILGDPWFEKSDKSNPEEKLQGAEFLVRNKSTLPMTVYNDYENDPEAQLITYPANTELYAVIKGSQVVGWTPSWREAIREGWLLVSNEAGLFNVGGLQYSRTINYRKMYTFAVMGVADFNGTSMQYVDHYEHVLANKRESTLTLESEEVKKEIESILKEHPGDESGAGSWRFYQESEADPELFKLDTNDMIDSLGETINNYELIEVKPPNKYTPLEVSKDDMDLDKPESEGIIHSDGTYIPSKDMESHFTHPLAFTVPGGTEDWNIGVPGDVNDITGAIDTPIIIPNVKKPIIPNTGNKIAMILLMFGILVIGIGVYYNKKNLMKKNK